MTKYRGEVNKIAAALSQRFGSKIDGLKMTEVQSLYWLEGQVQDDLEVRTQISARATFQELIAVMEEAHPYDVPMLITQAPQVGNGDVDQQQRHHSRVEDGYLQGLVEFKGRHAYSRARRLAGDLVEERLVACAQLLTSRTSDRVELSLKTQSGKRAQVLASAQRSLAEVLPDVTWSPIAGNAAYLQWVDESVGIRRLSGRDDL